MGGRHQRDSGECFKPILLDAKVAAPSEGGECWEFVRYCHDFRELAPSTMEGYVSSVVKHARIMQSRTFVVPQLYRDWMIRIKQVPRPPRSRAPITKDVVWAAAATPELGYDPKPVQGHSIRIGAATALAEAGVEFSTIM